MPNLDRFSLSNWHPGAKTSFLQWLQFIIMHLDTKIYSPFQWGRQDSLRLSSPLHSNWQERVATPISATSSSWQLLLSPVVFQVAMIATLCSPQLCIAERPVDNTTHRLISGSSISLSSRLHFSLSPSNNPCSKSWDGSSIFRLFAGGELVDREENFDCFDLHLDCSIQITLLEQSRGQVCWPLKGAMENFTSFNTLQSNTHYVTVHTITRVN